MIKLRVAVKWLWRCFASTTSTSGFWGCCLAILWNIPSWCRIETRKARRAQRNEERTGKGTEGRGKTKDQTMIIHGSLNVQYSQYMGHLPTPVIRGQRKETQTVGHWDRHKTMAEELKATTTDYNPILVGEIPWNHHCNTLQLFIFGEIFIWGHWLVKLKPHKKITKCPSFAGEIPWNHHCSLRSMANTSQQKPHHFIAPSSLHQASNLRRALWSLLTSPADKLGDGWCGLHERSQNKIRNKLKKLKNKAWFDLHAQDHVKHPYKSKLLGTINWFHPP